MSRPIDLEHARLKALLGKIGQLLNEAELIEPPPALVATPLPVAVSMDQAAALLGGVAQSTLDEYIHSGQLPTFRVGRRRLVRLDALNEFALAQESAESLVAGIRG